MTTRARVQRVVIVVVFALYVVFALKLLLFSRAPGSERSINLVPFADGRFIRDIVTIVWLKPTLQIFAAERR